MFNLAARSRNAYSRNCWKTSENKEEQKRLSSTGKSFQDRQFMHITWQSVHARVFLLSRYLREKVQVNGVLLVY